MKSFLGLTLALGAVGAGAYLMLGGRMPSMPHLSGSRGRRRRSGQLRGDAEATELKLFIDNDGDLYRQQTQPIIKNLQRKLAKGVFDKSKSEKLWMYLVENGAKKYAKQFSIGSDWHKIFSMADRKAVARALAEEFVSEYVS